MKLLPSHLEFFTETKIRVKDVLTDYTQEATRNLSKEITEENGKLVAMNCSRWDKRNDEGALVNESIIIAVAYEVRKIKCLECGVVLDDDRYGVAHDCRDKEEESHK